MTKRGTVHARRLTKTCACGRSIPGRAERCVECAEEHRLKLRAEMRRKKGK
jgi:hypothetical protein